MFVCVWEDACLCSWVFLRVFMLCVFMLCVVRSYAYVVSLACLHTCRCCFSFCLFRQSCNCNGVCIKLDTMFLIRLLLFTGGSVGLCRAMPSKPCLTDWNAQRTYVDSLDVCFGRGFLLVSWLKASLVELVLSHGLCGVAVMVFAGGCQHTTHYRIGRKQAFCSPY